MKLTFGAGLPQHFSSHAGRRRPGRSNPGVPNLLQIRSVWAYLTGAVPEELHELINEL